MPATLPHPPADWTVPYRKLAGDVGIDPRLDIAHAEAVTLLDPVLAGVAAGQWDPDQGRWLKDES